MGLRIQRVITLFVLLTSASCVPSACAVMPADQLLPDTACLFVSFPDMKSTDANFSKTQLGQLLDDPVIKPFAEDLASQLRNRFGQTELQLGLKWDDLEGVFAGEACLARTLPAQGEHAVIMLVDVTGHDQAVAKLKTTLSTNLKKRKATESSITVGKSNVTQFQLPKEVWQLKPKEVFFVVVQNQLMLTNHRGLLTDVVTRAEGGEAANRLVTSRTFSEVMNGVSKESGDLKPDVRWFIDPFHYAEVLRNSRSQRKRTRGTNFVQILRGQGFDAVRGAGGYIHFSPQGYEVLHRSYVFAPPVTDQPTKFNGAARMLAFPASKHMPIPRWVPRELATMMSMNWNVLNGFNYSTGLIDQVVDSEGFVEDVLKSFETDQNGPMINIREALLAHLDDHILTFSDNELPTTTKSERLLVAIRVKNEKAVVAALRKLWKDEPDAREVKLGDHVVWEIVPDEVDLSDIELPGSVPLPGAIPLPGAEADSGSSGEGDIKLPNSAMTVARGPDEKADPYFLICTSIDLLADVLAKDRPLHETLSASTDFQLINKELAELGAGDDSFRFFSRTDEEYRSTYELIKQGKMPESESMLGRLLNRMLGPEEENVLRKPEIDGTKMPDFQVVRRYLGPAGLYVKPLENGWFVTGIMVSKEALADPDAGAQASLTSESRSDSNTN